MVKKPYPFHAPSSPIRRPPPPSNSLSGRHHRRFEHGNGEKAIHLCHQRKSHRPDGDSRRGRPGILMSRLSTFPLLHACRRRGRQLPSVASFSLLTYPLMYFLFSHDMCPKAMIMVSFFGLSRVKEVLR
ncbi:hypothetical protein ZWY2020_025243, partial [Hordeum vulgare]